MALENSNTGTYLHPRALSTQEEMMHQYALLKVGYLMPPKVWIIFVQCLKMGWV
jgi:hypothetical protein